MKYLKNINYLLILGIILISACTPTEKLASNTEKAVQKTDVSEDFLNSKQEYDPQINPAKFTSKIDNPYFTLTPGKELTYEAETPEGIQRIEFYVSFDKKIVMGVETTVVVDRVWLEGELIEETWDWFAQDQDGNVWYFGEDTTEWENGLAINHNGAWQAGVDNAKPGIIMLANPKVGMAYKQEYYVGEAEDMAEVLSANEKVKTALGQYDNCIKTYEYSAIDPDLKEFKYYCKETGSLVLEEKYSENFREELISIKYEVAPEKAEATNASDYSGYIVPAGKEIGADAAKAIALNKIKGNVIDVSKEIKFGQIAYVVEIMQSNGTETDIIISLVSGELLGIEE